MAESEPPVDDVRTLSIQQLADNNLKNTFLGGGKVNGIYFDKHTASIIVLPLLQGRRRVGRKS